MPVPAALAPVKRTAPWFTVRLPANDVLLPEIVSVPVPSCRMVPAEPLMTPGTATEPLLLKNSVPSLAMDTGADTASRAAVAHLQGAGVIVVPPV